jgi:hypothetical protein
MPVQPDMAPALSGTINAVVQSPPPNPTTIITVNTPWNIQLTWSITGFLAPVAAGDWTVRAFLESMGPGFEGQVVGPVVVPLAEAPPGPVRNYARNLTVPANPLVTANAYKLVLTVTHTNGGVATQMAAFVEGPILQFIPA